MKIVIDFPGKETCKIEYPLLAKTKSGSFSIWFTGLTSGIVAEVNDPNSGRKLGEVCNSLIPHTNTDMWITYPKGTKIYLTNE